jgi:hypothetical protein
MLKPTDFWYLRMRSLGNSRRVNGLLSSTSSNQNILIFLTKFWYFDLMFSTTFLKFRSASSTDFLNWTAKNYSSECSSPVGLSSPLVNLDCEGDDGARTERVAASVLICLLSCLRGDVVTVTLAELLLGLEVNLVTTPHLHLIELTPWSEVLTSPQRHSAQMTWSQRRMVN